MVKAGKAPIGMYGNGFKSGSMRLGKDAIVFSRSKSVRCVGLLSQTYLQEIQAEQIVVPIVCFEKSGSNKYILYRQWNSTACADKKHRCKRFRYVTVMLPFIFAHIFISSGP